MKGTRARAAVLSPAEAKGVHPLLNVDDVYGALHSPTDGTLDPSGLTTALRIQLGHDSFDKGSSLSTETSGVAERA